MTSLKGLVGPTDVEWLRLVERYIELGGESKVTVQPGPHPVDRAIYCQSSVANHLYCETRIDAGVHIVRISVLPSVNINEMFSFEVPNAMNGRERLQYTPWYDYVRSEFGSERHPSQADGLSIDVISE